MSIPFAVPLPSLPLLLLWSFNDFIFKSGRERMDWDSSASAAAAGRVGSWHMRERQNFQTGNSLHCVRHSEKVIAEKERRRSTRERNPSDRNLLEEHRLSEAPRSFSGKSHTKKTNRA